MDYIYPSVEPLLLHKHMTKQSLILVFFFLFGINGFAQKQETLTINKDILLIPLSENVYIHQSWEDHPFYGRFPSNGMIIIKENEAVLIDTPFDEAKTIQLCTYIKDSMNVDIRQFIAGHYHEDCIGGINYLHEQQIPSLGNEMTRMKCHELGIIGPQHDFRKADTLVFHQDSIICYYPGPGHTFDNIVVYYPSQKIMFGGCIVKSARSSSLGNITDANTEEWDKSLENIKAAFPEAQVIVPGHGRYGGIELLGRSIRLVRTHQKKQ